MSYARRLNSPVLSALLLAGVLLGACGETREIGEDMGVDLSVGKQVGDTCGASTECPGGNCVDGVCCESACTGVCEACNLPGNPGKCEPIAMGVDPAMECMPKPLDVDGGTNDGGTLINFPDAGITVMDAPCAPKCDGKRACGFPDHTVACGDNFCNDSTNIAHTVCDGEGHCGVEVEACNAYVCGPSACKTTCSVHADCQSTHFCNTFGQCQAKKPLGAVCAGSGASAECGSGFCADAVCCNSDCAAISGGKCNNVGAVGQCKCTIQPGNLICDGTCEMYYLDADNDTYGSKTDVGIVGCTGDPDNNPAPPVGRVRDHTDCGDDNNAVHPKADFNGAAWTSVWSPVGDWDCDGVATREIPYKPGAACQFCLPRTWSILGSACDNVGSSTCSAAGQRAFQICDVGECSGSGFCLGGCCGYRCGDDGNLFGALNNGVFTSGGATCGSTGTLTICGTCDTVGTGLQTGSNNIVTTNQTARCK